MPPFRVESISRSQVERLPAPTWRGVIRSIVSMTPEELRARYGKRTAQHLLDFGDQQTLRELIVLRAVESFLDFPNAAMWNILMEREEGKVPNESDTQITIHDWRELALKMGLTEEEVIREAESIVRERLKLPERTLDAPTVPE